MRYGLLAVAAGCASGSAQGVNDASPAGTDAKSYLDAPDIEHADARRDAPLPDASIDAPHDAACVPTTTELLSNPALDLTPLATGWTEQNIDDTYPIITADAGLAPQSTPYRAWMGGFQGTDLGVSTVTDMLYQDVAVPVGTTQLELTGYYAVATAETGTNVYDTASVDVIQPSGTPIEAVLSLSNATSAASWKQLAHMFTANVAGQTVRLRFTTTNDITNATSFYFDTLSLKATHCP
jgi:hypothetical protein